MQDLLYSKQIDTEAETLLQCIAAVLSEASHTHTHTSKPEEDSVCFETLMSLPEDGCLWLYLLCINPPLGPLRWVCLFLLDAYPSTGMFSHLKTELGLINPSRHNTTHTLSKLYVRHCHQSRCSITLNYL